MSWQRTPKLEASNKNNLKKRIYSFLKYSLTQSKNFKKKQFSSSPLLEDLMILDELRRNHEIKKISNFLSISYHEGFSLSINNVLPVGADCPESACLLFQIIWFVILGPVCALDSLKALDVFRFYQNLSKRFR